MSTVAFRQVNRADTPVSSPAPTSTSRRFPARRTLIVLAIALVAAAAGVGVILAPRSSESTDDAYIGADATTVAPKVRGLVAEVLVRDNQSVHAGQPLVRI